jgi:mono/diheme cytochrome c family protein
MRPLLTRIIVRVFAAAIGLFLAIQLVPYGRDHKNPPVVREPAWESEATRQLVRRACFDCHSNQTNWPWYAGVAPASWLVYNDVAEGRESLNFSDWLDGRREGEKGDEIRKEIEEGEMPPFQYRLAHPESRLSGAEKQSLIKGLTATLNGR